MWYCYYKSRQTTLTQRSRVCYIYTCIEIEGLIDWFVVVGGSVLAAIGYSYSPRAYFFILCSSSQSVDGG